MPPPPPRKQQPSMATQLRRLDPKIWRACAGSSVPIPSLHSRVYYFPQGHFEHASSPPKFLSSLVLSKPCIHCRISEVHFLVDPVTDEVFAKLVLIPISNFNSTPYQNLGYLDESTDVNDDADDKVSAFAKILTPSDANNGGGFSVPRFCADSIFPPLNFQADPPVQTLTVTDVHGIVWEFRHIYRGTPRRHLLTTGWSKFVNHKKLVAGDSVVFMKNLKGEMFIGVRRSVRFHAANGPDNTSRYTHPAVSGMRDNLEDDPNQEEDCNSLGTRDTFSRNGRGKLSAKSVADAAELAANNMPFEVVYYPRAGWSDFVVKAELVEAATKVFWTPGMRVKMAVETEDSSRMTWFQGTVATAALPDVGPWQGSPWRSLQVSWDEPEVLQHSKRVSPWQVEYVSPAPPVHTAYPPAKKLRAPNNLGAVVDGEGDPLFPITGFTNSTMGSFRQSLLNYDNVPAGMQGARHDQFSVSNVSSYTRDSTSHLHTAHFSRNNVASHLRTVSTDLNIGSSQSENLSPDSQSSVHCFSTEFVGAHCYSTKPAACTIQLFGKVIHTKQPGAPDFEGFGYRRDEDPKGHNAAEVKGDQLDLTLTCTKLLDSMDSQCQRASTFEAFYL